MTGKSPRNGCAIRAIGILAIACFLVVLDSSAVLAQLGSRLEPLRALVGRTWKATIDAEVGVFDVARWDVVLAGQAVRMRVSTEMLRGGNWEDSGDMIYDEAPDAVVVLPDSSFGTERPGS